MDWLRTIVAGSIAAAVVSALAAVATRPPPEKAGRRRITPSAMHWTGIVLGTGLVVLMGYVRLFAGSSRADAESQMTILTWLIAAFAVATIGVALSMATIRRQAIRWRGTRLVYRRGSREHEADLTAVTAISTNILGQAVLTFTDGTTLRLDPYARGFQQLVETVAEHRTEVE